MNFPPLSRKPSAKPSRLGSAALRGARQGQVGPEPVIAYVFRREAEVAALRVLLLGQLARLDKATIRRSLRGVS